MTIPIYTFATVATVVVVSWSDQAKQRTPFLMGGLSVAVIGFIAELSMPHTKMSGVTYFFLLFVTTGLYCPFVCVVTLTAYNLTPSSKRAIGMALMISIGNLGSICGSNIFLA